MLASSAATSRAFVGTHSPVPPGLPAAYGSAAAVRGEAGLIAAAQANPEAFADLYHLYYPAIYRFAQRHTGDPTLAEDVAAETFLAALKALPHYEWRGIPFSAWLYRIAATVIAGQHRRNHGIATVPLENPRYPLSEPICEDPTPDMHLEQQEQQQQERYLLRRALARLTDDQRRAIELRYSRHELLPLAEVAIRMERSEGAVKLLLHRAVRALRRAMADIEPGEPPALSLATHPPAFRFETLN